jgi:hypothetical protein
MELLNNETTIPSLPSRPNIALVDNIDLSRLRHKYTQTELPKLTEQEWDLGEKEYRRFLKLIMLYPRRELVPSKAVDKIWHAHILDTMAYHSDCDALFGHYLHHFPYFGIYGEEDYQNLSNAFEETVRLYELHFGPYPGYGRGTDKKIDDHQLTDEGHLSGNTVHTAARCENHACHVKSECACRVKEACKAVMLF